MYDIIGDVHGHADALVALLKKLGYQQRAGAWRHSERQLISVGDLIDRGPGQRETVDILRAMVEAGSAQVIMGNHELNAVAWVLPDGQGDYLRKHSPGNLKHHQAFLEQAKPNSDWYHSTLDWFRSLPLYLDLPTCRVVHACWHKPSKQVVDDHTTAENQLRSEADWYAAHDRQHQLHGAVETLCKGLEVDLPNGLHFHDKAGVKRTAMRTRWWHQHSNNYRALALGVEPVERLPDADIPNSAMPGYDANKPVFFGHYWMRGTPHVLTPKVACLDWSVTQPQGRLVAYRFDGESQLNNDKFTWVMAFGS